MRKQQEMVAEFHRTMNIRTLEVSQRCELIEEESLELQESLAVLYNALHSGRSSRYVFARREEAIKEAVDLMYVTLGLLTDLGVDAEDAFRLVHESNMTKTPHYTARQQKLRKGPDYVAPDMTQVRRFGEKDSD